MIETFRRNDARRWCFRFAALCVFVALAMALMLVWAPELVRSVIGGAGGGLRTQILNLVIVAAFAVGLVRLGYWLLGAWREEAMVNRFCQGNFAVANAAPTAGADGAPWSLDGIGRHSAVRERAEVLFGLHQSGVAPETGALADALADREEPKVALARFSAGALVLLGLLGTFVGLLITIDGVSGVVRNLSVSPGDDIEAFLIPLREGLTRPLEGMALAFSTSLLGLASSLVLSAGGLALSAAQASWLGKLEQATAVFLLPALGKAAGGRASVGRAAGAVAAAASTPASAPAVGASELAQLEASMRFLRDSQRGTDEHLQRFAESAGRLAGGVDDFRERVAGLTAQLERSEALLARIADGEGASRQTLNDIAVKLADLAGASAAMRSDLRDGQEQTAVALRAAASGLRDGIEGGLAGVASGVAQAPGVPELRTVVADLRQHLERDAQARQQASHEILGELRRIHAELAHPRRPGTLGGAPGYEPPSDR